MSTVPKCKVTKVWIYTVQHNIRLFFYLLRVLYFNKYKGENNLFQMIQPDRPNAIDLSCLIRFLLVKKLCLKWSYKYLQWIYRNRIFAKKTSNHFPWYFSLKICTHIKPTMDLHKIMTSIKHYIETEQLFIKEINFIYIANETGSSLYTSYSFYKMLCGLYVLQRLSVLKKFE